MYRVDVEVDAVENLPNHRKLFPFVNVLLKLLNAITIPHANLVGTAGLSLRKKMFQSQRHLPLTKNLNSLRYFKAYSCFKKIYIEMLTTL